MYYKNVQNTLTSITFTLPRYSIDGYLIRLESLGNVVAGMAALMSILLKSIGRIQPGSAAFGLTQSLSVTGLLVRLKLILISGVPALLFHKLTMLSPFFSSDMGSSMYYRS